MKIVHLGFGAFHRAHQAPLTQAAGGWEIEAVAMRDPSAAEGYAGEYGLVIRAPKGPVVERVNVVSRVLALPGAGADVAAHMAQAEIITLTVTEKGYGIDRATGALDISAPRVAADLADPTAPESPPGLIVEACRLRRLAGLPGLTVMSCDNLPDNGAMTRGIVLDYAQRFDVGLAAWIAAECTFPSSMVDRITPASTDDTRAVALATLGRVDPLATETEPFCQWVIEDAFAGPRPEWERAGVQIVADVAPYEAMKLRMLNGAHSLIAYAGLHHGHVYVRDVMRSDLAQLVCVHMEAAARTLPDGLDTGAYADSLVARFENPAIAHACAQIAMDGSQKMPQRIFAPARAALEAGGTVASFVQATAYWMRHIQTDAVRDPMADVLRGAVAADDPVAALSALPGIDSALFERADWRASVRAALANL